MGRRMGRREGRREEGRKEGKKREREKEKKKRKRKNTTCPNLQDTAKVLPQAVYSHKPPTLKTQRAHK
jgi:hypothetical protein